MNKPLVGDRVAVVALDGSYRVERIEGRTISGVRVFSDGTTGKRRVFDALDVTRNYGATLSQDTGKAPVVPLSRESERLETRLQRSREKRANEWARLESKVRRALK